MIKISKNIFDIKKRLNDLNNLLSVMFVVLQGIDHKNVHGNLMKKMRDL